MCVCEPSGSGGRSSRKPTSRPAPPFAGQQSRSCDVVAMVKEEGGRGMSVAGRTAHGGLVTRAGSQGCRTAAL